MDEVKRLGGLKDQEINRAKEVLALKITKAGTWGGRGEQGAAGGARSVCRRGGGRLRTDAGARRGRVEEKREGDRHDDPAGTYEIPRRGRKLIKGGGGRSTEKKVTDEFYELQDSDFDGGEAMLKKGKRYSTRL